MKRIWRELCLVAVVLLGVTAVAAQEAQEVLLYEQGFDEGHAEGWELAPGWTVTQDGENWMLVGRGHDWALSHRQYPGDFRVGFRLRLVQGDVHLVYRLGQTGRYFVGFHEGGSHLSKQYWPDTFVGGLAGSDRAHSLGEWHEVEIVGQGALLRFLVDGEAEWEYTDPEPLLDGSFAFETLDDAVAYIDDIAVYGPAPAPTPTPDPRLSWVRTGGPLGGLGYDVRMRPDDPDVMYVTDALAGVFKSTDGGQTFSPDIRIDDVFTDTTHQCNPAIATDSLGTIFIAWEDYRNAPHLGDIYCARSTDSGVTFEEDLMVEDPFTISHRQIRPDIAVDDQGIVYVVWEDYRDNTELGNIYCSISIDSGNTFESDIMVDAIYTHTTHQANPAIASAGQGLVHIVWEDYRDHFDRANIYYSKSVVDGNVFGEDLMVNEPEATSSQLNPAIAVDNLGVVHLVWQE